MITHTLSSVMNANAFTQPRSPPPVNAQQRHRLTSTSSFLSDSSPNSSMVRIFIIIILHIILHEHYIVYKKYTQIYIHLYLERQHKTCTSLQQEDMDFCSLLREFQHMHLSGSEDVPVLVFRNKVLQSAKDHVSRSNFPWTKIPFVTFDGEEALDCGGPRREFFRYFSNKQE